MVCEVVVNNRSKSTDKIYDYALGEDICDKIGIGSCVTVTFGRGNKQLEAYVVNVKEGSAAKNLKTVIGLSRPIRLFDEKQLELIKWMREKYLVTYLDAIHAVAPSGTSVNKEEWIILCENSDVEADKSGILNMLCQNGGAMEINRLMDCFEGNISQKLAKLKRLGAITSQFRTQSTVRDKVVRVAQITLQSEEVPEIVGTLEKANAHVQARMLDILSTADFLSLADLVQFSQGTYNALRTLERKGYIRTYEKAVFREIDDDKEYPTTRPEELTEEQKAVITPLCRACESGEYKPFLLHGVTGSGKTEVYMQVIEKVLQLGKTAIMLVPEISLTPQTVARFKGRFGGEVAIIHSGLSLGEKYDQWKKIKNESCKIVIGARSAVFAPLDNIGVIIIDEEHEQTYKSEMTPRYSTHEVAQFRAKQYGAVLLLASATPLVTSYYSAKRGDMELLTMKQRVNKNAMPKVYVADLKEELANGNKSVISGKLQAAISKNLENHKQTILFLNRRGFSTFVSCRKCGFVASCPNCSISLTYHKFDDMLKCHYCGHTIKNYEVCPVCKSKYIRYFGGGTQKVEEEIHRLFPTASTIRMDVDTTGKKRSHEQILNKFEKEKIDILIGTQMVTKGLDFPNVTLVGVISADTILNIDDYRSQERTFSVLEQVTGRAGRAENEGISIIQTYSPDNKAIRLMQSHDYEGFYEEEIKVRKAMRYPPFCELVSVIFSGVNDSMTSDAAKYYRKNIEAFLKKEQNIQILGPVSSYISKIKNKYIYRMIIKCQSCDSINEALLNAQQKCEKNERFKGVTVVIDKNPNNMG